MDKKRKLIFKTAVVTELIISYMAVLTIISYARGPERYVPDTERPLLVTEDLTSETGEQAPPGGSLHIVKGDDQEVAKYTATIDLTQLRGIWVGYEIDCPEQYAGCVFSTDLCAEGYDNDEQEYRLSLRPGLNQEAFVLDPGDSAPDQAEFRFYTVDPADYNVTGIQVLEQLELPKVSGAMIAGAVICITVLAATCLVWVYQEKRSAQAGRAEEKVQPPAAG